jgi:altronate hydrolase
VEKTLLIDPRDNVVVALQSLPPGSPLRDGLTAVEAVPAKHKAALVNLAPGQPVRMYGVTVGKAVKPIRAGERISTENIIHEAEPFGARNPAPPWSMPDVSRWAGRTFQGYRRANGSAGTANHWIVLPLVFCENRNLQVIREALRQIPGLEPRFGYERLVLDLIRRHRSGEPLDAATAGPEAPAAERLFPNVDGVKFLIHQMGCGGTRGDARSLCALLAGYATHPNVAGVTVLSLGCQNAEVRMLEEEIAKRDPAFRKPYQILVQQAYPSEEALISAAIHHIFSGLVDINQFRREPISLNELCLGMECGGSDGFSGISANPVLGQVSDNIVALGGKSVLAEFPELCGVEQELINRSIDDATGARFAQLMRQYESWAAAVGASLSMNPSPGNIADGLITDAIKSAGAAKKGGTSPVVDVLDYTEPVLKPGLNLLNTPGNDAECTTALAASGSNVILFTTGLGTPMGNPVAPTLKIATNTDLAQRMSDIIDFDAGPVITGAAGIAELGGQLLDLVIATASGEYVPKAIRLGQDDFIPWKRGVSL